LSIRPKFLVRHFFLETHISLVVEKYSGKFCSPLSPTAMYLTALLCFYCSVFSFNLLQTPEIRYFFSRVTRHRAHVYKTDPTDRTRSSKSDLI